MTTKGSEREEKRKRHHPEKYMRENYIKRKKETTTKREKMEGNPASLGCGCIYYYCNSYFGTDIVNNYYLIIECSQYKRSPK